MKLPSVDETKALILDRAAVLTDIRQLRLEEAHSFVLARDITASFDIPPWDNSAMDGAALSADQGSGAVLPLAGTIRAGDLPGTVLKKGTCSRIFTGAPLPAGADAVVPQEDFQLSDKEITFPKEVLPGQHVRFQGGEIKKGSRVLEAGTPIRALEAAVLASLGIARVPVYRKLRVAVITNGNEVSPLGEGGPPGPGKIYNSNEYLLRFLLAESSLEIASFSLVGDSYQALGEALEAAGNADCILTVGGASEGDEDYLHRVLNNKGTVHCWKVGIKPGKPFMFGSLPFPGREVSVFGLPGNPGSVLAVMAALVLPALRFMQGQRLETLPPVRPAASGFALPSDKRQRYLRASLEQKEGRLTAVLAKEQSSATLLTAARSHGFAVIPPDRGVNKGDLVGFNTFTELFSF